MMGNKAGVNQAPSLVRTVKRLERVRAAIAQLDEQLKTPFRHADSKSQTEAKLAKLRAEEKRLAGMLADAKAALDAALKPAETASA